MEAKSLKKVMISLQAKPSFRIKIAKDITQGGKTKEKVLTNKILELTYDNAQYYFNKL